MGPEPERDAAVRVADPGGVPPRVPRRLSVPDGRSGPIDESVVNGRGGDRHAGDDGRFRPDGVVVLPGWLVALAENHGATIQTLYQYQEAVCVEDCAGDVQLQEAIKRRSPPRRRSRLPSWVPVTRRSPRPRSHLLLRNQPFPPRNLPFRPESPASEGALGQVRQEPRAASIEPAGVARRLPNELATNARFAAGAWLSDGARLRPTPGRRRGRCGRRAVAAPPAQRWPWTGPCSHPPRRLAPAGEAFGRLKPGLSPARSLRPPSTRLPAPERRRVLPLGLDRSLHRRAGDDRSARNARRSTDPSAPGSMTSIDPHRVRLARMPECTYIGHSARVPSRGHGATFALESQGTRSRQTK